MVTFNRLELTKKTIEGALTHTGKKYNLIICDNGSTDGTLEWLAEEKLDLSEMEGLTVVRLPKNHGVAYGRNMCLKTMNKYYPDTKFVGTIDNDVAIPNKNWLRDCCDVVNANEKYGACALNYENKIFPTTTLTLCDGRKLQVRIIINTPGTATTIFRKEVHDKIGYFKRYGRGTYGHEDGDFFFSY